QLGRGRGNSPRGPEPLRRTSGAACRTPPPERRLRARRRHLERSVTLENSDAANDCESHLSRHTRQRGKGRPTHEKIEHAIEQDSICANLEQAERAQIIESMKYLTFEDGDLIVMQGKPGNTFFAIHEGKARPRGGEGDQHPVGGQRLRGPRARLRVPAHGDAARQREVRRVGRPRRRLPRRAAKARQEEARREPEVHRLHAHVRRAAAPAEGPPGRPLLHQSLRGREAGAAGGRQRRGHLLREARLAVLPLARARGPRQPAAGARGLLRGAGARGEHQAGRNRGDSGALRTVRHQRGGAQGGAGGRCGAQVAAGVHHERLQKLAGILPLLFHAAPGHDRGDRVQGLRPRQPHRQRPALRGGDKRRGHWRRPVRRAARPRRLVRGRLLRLEARRRAAEHAPAAAVRVLRVRRHGRRGVGDAAG
ncbi:unnamed protein product, partial [Prorocentrum cordatum]